MIGRGRRRYGWRGPQPAPDEEQIANAPDGLFPFTPVSDTPAAITRGNWDAVLPDETPFTWDRRRTDGREDTR